ncbi:hypothetical protein [Sporosarcina sp. FSL K6-1508]|uniref:hypothetical protein n=1 Tax=Sporosarcina sp. FSL K6-1508 TaxID=2921553 RepID=UPI0030F60A2D
MYPVLGERWTNGHHAINEKNTSECDKFTFRRIKNFDNSAVVVQSEAIRKRLYIGHLWFNAKASNQLMVNFGYSTYVTF